MIYIYIYSFI